MPLKVRLAKEIGVRVALRVYWGGKDCPNCLGGGKPGYHSAQIHLIDSSVLGNWEIGGDIEDYPDDRWPTKCGHCNAGPPDDVNRQVFRKRLYDTDSGKLGPGDMYWADWFDRGKEGGCSFHENCDGRHLHVICPDGSQWDIDGRASNCTMKEDRVHRCWIRTGEPPNVTVGKSGNTCAAGAGSIAVDGYHGFLRNGSFT